MKLFMLFSAQAQYFENPFFSFLPLFAVLRRGRFCPKEFLRMAGCSQGRSKKPQSPL